MPDYLKSQGLSYLQGTKHHRETLFDSDRENIAPCSPLKEYPEAEKILLPRPSPPEADIWDCLQKRRSVRKYSKRPLEPESLSALLWASQGITATMGRYLLRTAPSAGALYPVETYLCVNNCVSIKRGIYHYDPVSAALELLAPGDFGERLAHSAFGQRMCSSAPVVFIWSAIPRRTMAKYGSRGMRYIFMDAAHICANLLLAVPALGLGACPIGAFFDDEVNSMLGLDGEEETVVYMATVGFPKNKKAP